ncbi:MAG: thermonuclease family protein [Bdellovibrionales bacterium]|nr:thermonuclease family protein [Bdellovibrionales bacterium]
MGKVIGGILGLGIYLWVVPAAWANSCHHDNNNFRCVEFVSNYDGDTFRVIIPQVHPFFGEDISVRVIGIDAPEIRTHDECEKRMALKAKEELKELLETSHEITLRSIGKDKYFRVLADVKFDGKDLAEELLKRRLAVPYDGGTKPHTNWCKFE